MTPDRAALEALVEAIDYCRKTGHLRHPVSCYCSFNAGLEDARAALATPPAPEAAAVERTMPSGASFAWHSEQHGPDGICGGCKNHIGWHMEQCGCKELPWCVPHPSEGIHQWRSMCRWPHDHVEHRPAPTPPAPTGSASAERRRLTVKVDIDTETDRMAVWKAGIGWVEVDTADLLAALAAQEPGR